jgi:peptidyl-prolyl cis-trans isomerase C
MNSRSLCHHLNNTYLKALKRNEMMTKVGISFLVVLSNLLLTNAHAATLATVNGKAITDEDLAVLVSNLPAQQKERLLKDPSTKTQLVQNLIDQEVMVQEAQARKIENSKEYRDALNNFRKQALVNILVQKMLAPTITEAMVKDHFAKHKVSYSGDEVHAQHILLSTEAEAQAVLAEVKKPGVDFQKVAETKSKDPTAKNNRGDLGFFGHDMYDQAFTDAAFTTKAGDVTGPVKTPYGYHVIKVVERKAGKTPEFAEIEQKVRADVQREVLQNYVNQLRKKDKITTSVH